MTNKTIISKWTLPAILLFTTLLYIRAIFNDFASLDDNAYIIENPFFKDFSLKGFYAIFTSFYCSNYHPLTTLIHFFEYKWFGLNPLPYHLISVLVHLLNIWLIFKLTEQLSGNRITSLVVTVLFAAHPMHVESVAWISELKDVLYSFFYLISLRIYFLYINSGYKLKYYVFTLLFFVASLLSKSAAVTLSVLLIIIDIYKNRKFNKRALFEKIPFVLLSLFFGILAIHSQRLAELVNDGSFSFSFIDKVFLFTYTLSFYILKLVAPFNLSAMHYFPEMHNGALPWQYYVSLPFLLVIIYLVFKRNFLRKEIIFGVLFFLVSISVMLQVVPVGMTITAERYTYISYIGLFYIIGQWISGIEKEKIKKIIFVFFALFIIMLSCLTFQRISVWKNGEVLFTDVIKKNPDIFNGYWTRGKIRYSMNNLQGALNDYDKTLEYKPNFVPCLTTREDVRIKLKFYNGELQVLNNIINRDSTNHMAYNNRGILKAKTGDIEGALTDFNMAIKLAPDNAEAYGNRGNLKNLKSDYAGAVKDYTYSLRLIPDNNMVYYNRGISRFFLKDTVGACEDWKKAVSLGYKDAIPMVKQYCK